MYRLVLNTDTGAIRLDGLAAAAANPLYLALHPNGGTLYAVNEISDFEKQDTGAITSFAVDTFGRLSQIGQVASGGKAPCYISVDRRGGYVLVANYAGPRS